VRREPGGDAARRRFTAEYGAKYPKAVAALTTDHERLLTLFDYPAEHWKHLLRTSRQSTLASSGLTSTSATPAAQNSA